MDDKFDMDTDNPDEEEETLSEIDGIFDED